MTEDTRQTLIVFISSVIIGVILSLLISFISQNSTNVSSQDIADAEKTLLRRANFEDIKGSTSIRAENLQRQLTEEIGVTAWSEETKTTSECTPAENHVSGATSETTTIKAAGFNLNPEETQKAKETIASAVRNGYGGQSLTTPNSLTIKSERSGQIHLNTEPLSLTITTDCYLPQERKDQIWDEMVNP